MSDAIRLGEGGEFDRIRDILAVLGSAAHDIGDDAARVPEGIGTLVISTDTSVEGVHFESAWLSDADIGWRATAAALSDLAAMGARAVGVVVALSRPGTDAERATRCMTGVADAVRFAGCPVLGGDLTGGPILALTVTVLGRAVRPIGRDGARPGDRLWLTGSLGGSRAALTAWQRGQQAAPAARYAFARPHPRLGAGQWLADQGATAMLDLSDGLAGDASHLAAASRVRLEISLDRVPVHSSVYREAAAAGVPPACFAATGGEDYELLVAMPPDWTPQDPEAWIGTSLTPIGRVLPGEGVICLLQGESVRLCGYRHV